MKNDKISVVIRTKNEERWIGYAIQSVLNHLNKPEIIIVDNNSTDETLTIINYFIQDKVNGNKNYTNIKIYKIKDYTPGKSLNLGVKKSKNQNILIMSAHCQLEHINLKQHFKDLKKYVCIFGKQEPIFRGKKINKRYIWSHFQNKKTINMFSKLENRYFLHNALAIFRKNTLIKYKFNEILAGKEDRYWANNQIKNKKKILYDPELKAIHHYTENGNTWKGMA